MKRYGYKCDICNKMDIQDSDTLPSDWVEMECEISGKRTRKALIHVCQTCKSSLSVDIDSVSEEVTDGDKIVALIKSVSSS